MKVNNVLKIEGLKVNGDLVKWELWNISMVRDNKSVIDSFM